MQLSAVNRGFVAGVSGLVYFAIPYLNSEEHAKHSRFRVGHEGNIAGPATKIRRVNYRPGPSTLSEEHRYG